ncbi:MAG: pyridoxal-phosphate dependent enzyme [Phycisphaerales bacterium]|nr:pyridoxal-phosphate dependent enzyme [Phycisphaerales bacterium]
MQQFALENTPRFPLAQLPTPIVRVSPEAFGVPLLVKRDDLTGNGLSGNKVRKLEYLLADARAAGADTLLSCGAVQSNCARALAVAAAMTGFRCHLILTGERPGEPDGNFLIDQLAGADIEVLESDDAALRDAVLAERANVLRQGGHSPYLVPFGGSSIVGTLGYVRAGLELAAQLGTSAGDMRHVVAPLASGGTYAGLFLGLSLAGVPIRPVGAFVQGTATEWVPVLLDLIHGAARKLGVVVDADESDINLIDARGDGYGLPNRGELQLIADFCRTTGMLLDPVYTGKALYALLQYVKCGAIDRDREIVFLHTGGTLGLFPHRAALAEILREQNHPAQHAPIRTPSAKQGAEQTPPHPSTVPMFRETDAPAKSAQRISIASP